MKRKLAAMVVALCLAGAAWGVWDLYQPYRGFAVREMLEIPPGTRRSRHRRPAGVPGRARPQVAFPRPLLDWTHSPPPEGG